MTAIFTYALTSVTKLHIQKRAGVNALVRFMLFSARIKIADETNEEKGIRQRQRQLKFSCAQHKPKMTVECSEHSTTVNC